MPLHLTLPHAESDGEPLRQTQRYVSLNGSPSDSAKMPGMAAGFGARREQTGASEGGNSFAPRPELGWDQTARRQ